jgi:hypothetical protein
MYQDKDAKYGNKYAFCFGNLRFYAKIGIVSIVKSRIVNHEGSAHDCRFTITDFRHSQLTILDSRLLN